MSNFGWLKKLVEPKIELKDGFEWPNVPWSKVAILGMVIPPLIGNPYNGYINPYYWVDDHPLLYGNNGSLDPGTNMVKYFDIMRCCGETGLRLLTYLDTFFL